MVSPRYRLIFLFVYVLTFASWQLSTPLLAHGCILRAFFTSRTAVVGLAAVARHSLTALFGYFCYALMALWPPVFVPAHQLICLFGDLPSFSSLAPAYLRICALFYFCIPLMV